MLSRARIAGHPIHPMLVGFPIVLFVATVVLELAHIGTQDAFYYRAAMLANIAGVVMGALAAIPGLIDRFTLLRGTRARDLVNRHAVFNGFALVVFGISAVLLGLGWSGKVMVDGAYVLDAHIPLAFDLVGIIAMVTGTMLGWALVQTHHVGIKPAQVYGHRPSREPELDSSLVYRTN